jgi:hypothetical protein
MGHEGLGANQKEVSLSMGVEVLFANASSGILDHQSLLFVQRV